MFFACGIWCAADVSSVGPTKGEKHSITMPTEVSCLTLGGGYSTKVWVGGCRPDLETLTLFMIKSSWKSWKIDTLHVYDFQVKFHSSFRQNVWFLDPVFIKFSEIFEFETLFMSGRSKNHTLKGGTSSYSLCMGVPPPGAWPSQGVITNYLLTESEVCTGNIKLRPCCIDRAIVKSLPEVWYFRKDQKFEIDKYLTIWHLATGNSLLRRSRSTRAYPQSLRKIQTAQQPMRPFLRKIVKQIHQLY